LSFTLVLNIFFAEYFFIDLADSFFHRRKYRAKELLYPEYIALRLSVIAGFRCAGRQDYQRAQEGAHQPRVDYRTERAKFQEVKEKGERRDHHGCGAKQYVDYLQTGLKEFHLFCLPLFLN